VSKRVLYEACSPFSQSKFSFFFFLLFCVIARAHMSSLLVVHFLLSIYHCLVLTRMLSYAGYPHILCSIHLDVIVILIIHILSSCITVVFYIVRLNRLKFKIRS
jgi:hypothetical protein